MADQRYCRNCGAPNLPDAKFCANCGAAIVSATASPPRGAPSAAPSPPPRQPPYTSPPTPPPQSRTIFGLTRKMIAVGLVVVVLLLTLGCVALMANTPSTTTTTSPTATPTVTARPVAKATATPKVTATPQATATPSGQGTTSNDHYSFSATYQGVYTESNEFLQPKAGDKYVQVHVEVTNKDQKDALIGNMFQFKLFDNTNTGHDAATVSADQITSLQNSNPGDKAAGIVVFEIPSGNTPTKIVFEPGLFEESLTVNF